MRVEIYFGIRSTTIINITACAAVNNDENDESDHHNHHHIIIHVNSQTKHCGVLLCIKNAGHTLLLPSTHSTTAHHCGGIMRCLTICDTSGWDAKKP